MPEQRCTVDPSLKMGLLSSIEAMVNKSLALDPVTIKRLSQHDGAVIQVDCIEPEFVTWLWMEKDGIRLAAYHEGSVDARISGTFVSYMELMICRRSDFGDIAGLDTFGDKQLIDELGEIHKSMELDWEALACRYLGDVAGHGLFSGLKELSVGVRSLLQQGMKVLPGCLQDELNVLPAVTEMDSFQEELTKLKADVDQLSEKISNLDEQINR